MKKLLTLSAGIGLILLTGCAATGTRYSATDAPMAVSTLSSAPVTMPEELVKWTQFYPNNKSGWFKSTDIVTFRVAADGRLSDNSPRYSETTQPDSAFREAAGGEMGGYRYVRHTPNQR